MADVSGKRTRVVSADLGIQILGGFLQGFHLPAADIQEKFKDVTGISFGFEEVYRNWIDINALGARLEGRRLRHNAASEIFFESGYALLVISSTITSDRFSIKATNEHDTKFKLDVPGIEAIVGKTNVGVKTHSVSELEVSFEGDTKLAFAFSSIYAALERDGTIHALYPHDAGVLKTFDTSEGTPGLVLPSAYSARVSSEPCMIELTMDDVAV